MNVWKKSSVNTESRKWSSKNTSKIHPIPSQYLAHNPCTRKFRGIELLIRGNGS